MTDAPKAPDVPDVGLSFLAKAAAMVVVLMFLAAVAAAMFFAVKWQDATTQLRCVSKGFSEIGLGTTDALRLQIGQDRTAPLDRAAAGARKLGNC